MTRPPERSPERDAAITAALPNVAFDGWTVSALRRGLMAVGMDPEDAMLLFPGGSIDMIETFCGWKRLPPAPTCRPCGCRRGSVR
jgi:ubiquinone biosynthesis protein COQ9